VVGALLFLLAFKLRCKVTFKPRGQNATADGSALPFVLMAESLGDDGGDYNDGGADIDFD